MDFSIARLFKDVWSCADLQCCPRSERLIVYLVWGISRTLSRLALPTPGPDLCWRSDTLYSGGALLVTPPGGRAENETPEYGGRSAPAKYLQVLLGKNKQAEGGGWVSLCWSIKIPAGIAVV